MGTAMNRVLLLSAMALSAALSAPAWAANDYSGFDCTGKDFVAAFQDAMNTSDEFAKAGLKVVSITDAENVEATTSHLTCQAMFQFGSGEKLEETFTLHDNSAGHMAWSYKPTDAK
jgi:hypothetical protein